MEKQLKFSLNQQFAQFKIKSEFGEKFFQQKNKKTVAIKNSFGSVCIVLSRQATREQMELLTFFL